MSSRSLLPYQASFKFYHGRPIHETPAGRCPDINNDGKVSVDANGFTMIAIMPKLYALSAMWTLNSRKDIRLVRSHGQNTSSTEATSGRCHTNNVELRALSTSGHRVLIQVRTQVQTIQQTDDVFLPKSRDIRMVSY
ncbi:hypothetical protein B0H14DRAFT_3488759 [Mycena olivaceomarginata]|nr:hypothetical protein B0H14DRAFT_3488759 [Mycena olivaceomarginata]